MASIVVDTAHIVVDYRHVTLYNCCESARGQYYIVTLKFQCFKAFTTSARKRWSNHAGSNRLDSTVVRNS